MRRAVAMPMLPLNRAEKGGGEQWGELELLRQWRPVLVRAESGSMGDSARMERGRVDTARSERFARSRGIRGHGCKWRSVARALTRVERRAED